MHEPAAAAAVQYLDIHPSGGGGIHRTSPAVFGNRHFSSAPKFTWQMIGYQLSKRPELPWT